jgi:hypothetical protein
LFKKTAQGAAFHSFAVRDLTETTLQGNFAIDGLDDFEDRDLVCWPGQDEASTSAPLGTQHTGLGQVLKNLREKTLGDSFVPADRVDHDRLSHWLPGQMEKTEDPVFSCA